MKIVEMKKVEINANFTRRKGLCEGWQVCAILQETEKAYNVVAFRFPNGVKAMWVPKVCLEEALRDHEVLVDCEYKEAIDYGWNQIRWYS